MKISLLVPGLDKLNCLWYRIWRRFTFNGFSEQALIMNARNHALCARKCGCNTTRWTLCQALWEPTKIEASLEEDRPNGPDLGMSSNSQDACHIAHVGHDTGEAEMKQLSRFQHLEKMVKLIAMHVDLGPNSDPVCSDVDNGSDVDPLHRRHDPDHHLVTTRWWSGSWRRCRGRSWFSTTSEPKQDMFDVDSVAEYVSNYLYSTISNDSFKAIKERTKNPNIKFFEAPM